MHPFFKASNGDFTLYCGDSLELVPQLTGEFDMIFADPPYFLSNGGFSVQAGKKVSVNKGSWDESNGFSEDAKFNYNWLKACRDKMADNGTIWVCGTFHNIFSVANALTELDYRILNAVTWQKTNPPPNVSCHAFNRDYTMGAKVKESSPLLQLRLDA